MNFDEYKKMKNFSSQQNFALKSVTKKLPKELKKLFKKLKNNKEDASTVASIIGSNLKGAASGVWNLGKPYVNAAKELKANDNFISRLIHRANYGESLNRTANKLNIVGHGLNALGRGAIISSAIGIYSIPSLIKSDGIKDDRYYVFDEESSSVVGSKSGYKTKAEAVKVRDEKYPGERINLGKTLKFKYKGDKG